LYGTLVTVPADPGSAGQRRSKGSAAPEQGPARDGRVRSALRVSGHAAANSGRDPTILPSLPSRRLRRVKMSLKLKTPPRAAPAVEAVRRRRGQTPVGLTSWTDSSGTGPTAMAGDAPGELPAVLSSPSGAPDSLVSKPTGTGDNVRTLQPTSRPWSGSSRNRIVRSDRARAARSVRRLAALTRARPDAGMGRPSELLARLVERSCSTRGDRAQFRIHRCETGGAWRLDRAAWSRSSGGPPSGADEQISRSASAGPTPVRR
jgi:hypothetical protein